jgi:hypothetical protein
MPTATYTPLANVTLATAASSISFSSIPATPYRDLILVFTGINTTDDVSFSMRINGDTGANYSYVVGRGQFSSTVASNALSSQTSMFIAGWSYGQGTTNGLPVIVQIMDYSATDKHKTTLDRYQTIRNNGEEEVGMVAGRWASTSAITSISVFPNSSTLKAGTTASLYGVIA